MSRRDFDLAGMSADQMYLRIQDAGVNSADAAIMVAEWINESVWHVPSDFNYHTTFPGVNADCEVGFTRTFQHSDWVDGQSVVQAEESLSEQGFNTRFHKIEDDLDSLGAGLAQLSLCMAEMRSGLRALLDEIRAELNRRPTAPPPGVVVDRPDDIVVTKPPHVKIPDWRVNPPIYLGTTEYFGVDVHVWETEAGVITLPTVNPIALGGVGNVRVQRTQTLATLVAQSRPLQAAIGRGATKADLVKQFGEVRAPDGQSFTSLVGILPDDARFDSTEGLIQQVASHEAAALRTTPGGTESIAASLGTSNFADAPLGRLQMVPGGALEALERAGIDTVAKLAQASPKEVAGIASAQAPGVTQADASGWTAAAGMLVGMTAGAIG
jgi:hypothetical protein